MTAAKLCSRVPPAWSVIKAADMSLPVLCSDSWLSLPESSALPCRRTFWPCAGGSKPGLSDSAALLPASAALDTNGCGSVSCGALRSAVGRSPSPAAAGDSSDSCVSGARSPIGRLAARFSGGPFSPSVAVSGAHIRGSVSAAGFGSCCSSSAVLPGSGSAGLCCCTSCCCSRLPAGKDEKCPCTSLRTGILQAT